MPSERVNTAVAYLRTGSRDLGPLREMRLTADEYDDLLAAVRWDYETARGIKDAVQSLAAKQRGEEAAGRSAGERRAGRAGTGGRALRRYERRAESYDAIGANTRFEFPICPIAELDLPHPRYCRPRRVTPTVRACLGGGAHLS